MRGRRPFTDRESSGGGEAASEAESPGAVRGARLVEGTVRARLPSGLYEVEVDGRYRITVHVGGGFERNFVRALVGDRVVVELAERDRSRGRIIKRAQG